LPDVRSIRRWIGKIEFQPGFSKHVFFKLKKVTENWSIAKRLTVLLFDEMSIKKGLEYSNDCFEGFQDSLSLQYFVSQGLGELGRIELYMS
jgi:hypothetical protein